MEHTIETQSLQLKDTKKTEHEPTDYSGYFNRWLRECRAMANHAFSTGERVPGTVMRVLEGLEGGRYDAALLDIDDEDEIGTTPSERLAYIHNALSKVVRPASPKTILLMADETEKNSILLFLGKVPFVRKMMATALLCLAGLVSSSLSLYINEENLHKTIFHSNGVELLVVFVFLLSAAGLGASFAGLFRVNKYITAGTFDPKYETSYWIRFLVGLISGLILTQIFSFDYASALGEGKTQELSSMNAAKVTLALLGGFSADLVFNILNRMVETVSSFVIPTEKVDREACEREMEVKLAAQLSKTCSSLTKEINLLRQKLPRADEETQAEIDKILDRCFKRISDSSMV